MPKFLTRPILPIALAATTVAGLLAWSAQHAPLEASSHREAPLIADDPLADNTDVYAFRDPNNAEMVNIIANYIPLELPQGGPNYNTFGENVRYEIHIKNDGSKPNADDITYRFTFKRVNEDDGTFFNIRLGKQNLKATYTMERSVNGGAFVSLKTEGVVPPPNIGPRSITGAAGLGAPSYEKLFTDAIIKVDGDISVFCGPVDDPFFVDLGGIFDLGGIRAAAARDGVARKNTHTIALQIPIAKLQKGGKTGAQAANILDPDYVIGVWASASRQSIRTISTTDGTQAHSGTWVQVSRLGMPLMNEVIQPIGSKDRWNYDTPYTERATSEDYLSNPELGLYMAEGDGYFGTAVPGFANLRIQRNSLGQFDFGNGKNGVSALLNAPAASVAGTAFAKIADGGFAEYLLRPGKPRSVDILPIFHTGVPNLPPYQLANIKPAGQPLAPGKPFVNTFMPLIDNPAVPAGVGGDMLRLNMAVPTTPRNSTEFSSEGLLAAAVLGLTDARFNTTNTLQFIPNMDGFPNGRRLEDDITRIELQAVGGVVLHAIGLPYEAGAPGLAGVLGFRTGIEANDIAFRSTFPYMALPWSGTEAQGTVTSQIGAVGFSLKPEIVAAAQNYPNPFVESTKVTYEVATKTPLTMFVSDLTGRRVATIMEGKAHKVGKYALDWKPGPEVAAGTYVLTIATGKTVLQSMKLVHNQ
ncbi:DUF4331 family protein [Hymenobacter psychrophilus]|uniref:Por secretion system C-terminal sorting domain-containing protein n=1 Tax=Hymenobacter psychrophilus TaxID=651662 RepID=A0A1H3EF92_9BACT|nr:DUF4331 family protein [Hymenobacter psychrophilus]SDX77290.1 Por secretion system C-terminal sorting domain-containing protein [Hymenobacter psychrophilus]